MSDAFVKVLRFGSAHALQLCDKFWTICPEEVWRKEAGGWPVGQQFYHLLMASSMFLSTFGVEGIENPDPKAGQLGEDREYCPSKEDAKRFFNSVSIGLNKLLDRLTDAVLLENNLAFSQRLGKEVNNAECLNLMCAHMLYHLGSCDAALRNEGLEGAF